MKILFELEEAMVSNIVKQNPKMGAKLQVALKKIYRHLPEKLLSDRPSHSEAKPLTRPEGASSNKKLVLEFLGELVKSNRDHAVEKYFSMVTEDEASHALDEHCIATDDLQDNLFKSLASYGLTKLIRDVLAKMAKADFKEKDIKNLVDLITARNHMRQNEEKFLHDAFLAYLKKQISLYK